MKLTKGRLSKLYRKTNQSKRRIKKNKKRPVLRNTFRKRRPFDLNRKTLKRLRGGQGTAKEELEKLKERRKNLIDANEAAKKNLIDANEAAKKKYNDELKNASYTGQLGQTASLNAAEIERGKKHNAAIGIIDNRIAELKYGSTGVKEDEDKKTERLEAERLEAEKKKAEEEAARLEAEKKQLEAEKEAARVNGIAVGDSTQNTPMQIAKGYAVDDTNDNEIISAVNVQGEPIKKEPIQTTEIQNIQNEYTRKIEEAGQQDANITEPIKDTAQNEIQDVQNEYTRKIEEAARELTQKLLAIAANKVTNVGNQDSMAATTAVANTMANVGITDNTSSNGNSQTFPDPSAPLPPPHVKYLSTDKSDK